MTHMIPPTWTPQVVPGSRILIVGASGGIGTSLIDMILQGPTCTIGAHRASSPAREIQSASHTIFDMQKELATGDDCDALVEDFIAQAGGIDALVVLSGTMNTKHFSALTPSEWEADIQVNLNIPFYLSRAAMRGMSGPGSILLTGTESALHGGSPVSFPYGVAKRGTECLVQGLARDGAPRDITVNGIRMGLILSGLHEQRQQKTKADMIKRAEMVPLKRGGTPAEAAALILYLISGWGRFITGQMIPLTGGDWL